MPRKYSSAFLSSRHMRGPELQEARLALEKAGISVTSRWLSEARPTGDGADPHWIAHVTREDIERADVYILRGDERGDSGQRHVEFGLAMGLGKHLIVVAPEPENMWQRLPGVQVLPDWPAVHRHLSAEAS